MHSAQMHAHTAEAHKLTLRFEVMTFMWVRL